MKQYIITYKNEDGLTKQIIDGDKLELQGKYFVISKNNNIVAFIDSEYVKSIVGDDCPNTATFWKPNCEPLISTTPKWNDSIIYSPKTT